MVKIVPNSWSEGRVLRRVKRLVRERIEVSLKDVEIKRGSCSAKLLRSIRKRVGIVFQFSEYQLFKATVEEDIMFGPLAMGYSYQRSRYLAQRYLELVGLDKAILTSSPFNLSGGQKRRVAIAGILAMEPDFLIFDEPTAGLDPAGVNLILGVFKRLNEMGKTIIICTHELDNVLR